MHSPLMVALSLALVASTTWARGIPDPNLRPAPGNEAPQVPLAEAAYSAPVNYQLQCAGCHLHDGRGSTANDVPRMTDFVGNFLKVEGGREFLIRVPGMAQSALNDDQLADLMNWMMRRDGIAGVSTPENYIPFTGQEVAAVRHKAILNVPSVREGLIKNMRAKGIQIDDGLSY